MLSAFVTNDIPTCGNGRSFMILDSFSAFDLYLSKKLSTLFRMKYIFLEFNACSKATTQTTTEFSTFKNLNLKTREKIISKIFVSPTFQPPSTFLNSISLVMN